MALFLEAKLEEGEWGGVLFVLVVDCDDFYEKTFLVGYLFQQWIEVAEQVKQLVVLWILPEMKSQET